MAMKMKLRRRKARKQRSHRLIRAGDRTMTFVQSADGDEDGFEPSIQEIEAAIAEVPDELDWEWSSRRLIPVFERGYAEGVTGDPMINSVTSLGIGIGFGIDLGPMVGRVTRSMCQRWEASVDQLERAAFAHLAEAVAGINPSDVQPIVLQGHFFRALTVPLGWASSVILAGEPELIRIFGTRDAFFTAPTRHTLLAFGPGTPTRVVAGITVECELQDPHPLQLDPFLLQDGLLLWEGALMASSMDES